MSGLDKGKWLDFAYIVNPEPTEFAGEQDVGVKKSLEALF